MMARSTRSNRKPDTLMQDRISQSRGNLLHRTAGPYIGANNRREQVQLIGAEAGRPRTRTRSVWSTPQGPLGCPKLRWHQLCARRDSSGARAAISRSSIAGQTDAPTICRSWPPRLAQPPNESVGRLALRRGGVVALRPNIASPMSPLMSQLSAKSCRYAGSIP